MELRRAAAIVPQSNSCISKRISATFDARRSPPGRIHAMKVSTCAYTLVANFLQHYRTTLCRRLRFSEGLRPSTDRSYGGVRAKRIHHAVLVIYLQVASPLQRFHNQHYADPGTPLI